MQKITLCIGGIFIGKAAWNSTVLPFSLKVLFSALKCLNKIKQ